MRTEPYETFKVSGLTVEIIPDDDATGPDEFDNDGLFLVGFHRDFTVKREGFDLERVRAALTPEYARGDDALSASAKEIRKLYHVLPLEAYIHGGVMLALGSEGKFPDRQWDVSALGAVFVSRKEWRTKEKARKAALSLIEEWNTYLSGDVYGYRVLDAKGEELSAVWGFYGLPYAIEEGKSAAEYHASDLLKKHVAKKKAEIKNRVPLSKRKEK